MENLLNSVISQKKPFFNLVQVNFKKKIKTSQIISIKLLTFPCSCVIPANSPS